MIKKKPGPRGPIDPKILELRKYTKRPKVKIEFKTHAEAAKERAEGRLPARKGARGAKTVEESAPEILPFDATLAYVFRAAGGRQTAINAARLAMESEPRLIKFLYAYDTANFDDQRNFRLEDLCTLAEISPDEFLAAIIPALWRRNVDIGKLIAAINHPKIVEATIKTAQTPHGVQDRKMLHDHMGFLPLPKGQTINVDNSQRTLIAGGKVVEDVATPGLPSFEECGKEMIQVLHGGASATTIGGIKTLPPPTKSQEIKELQGESTPPSPEPSPEPNSEIIEAELVQP